MIHSVRKRATRGDVILIRVKPRNDSRFNVGTMHIVYDVDSDGGVFVYDDDDNIAIKQSFYEVFEGIGKVTTRDEMLRDDPLTPSDVATAILRGKIRFVEIDDDIICESTDQGVLVSGKTRDLEKELSEIKSGNNVTISKNDPVKIPLLFLNHKEKVVKSDIPKPPKNYITKEEAKSMIDSIVNRKLKEHHDAEHKKFRFGPPLTIRSK